MQCLFCFLLVGCFFGSWPVKSGNKTKGPTNERDHCGICNRLHNCIVYFMDVQKMTKQVDFFAQIKDYKKMLILTALEDSKGKVSKAAQQLTLKRTTLVEMMKILEIDWRVYRGQK